MSDKYLYSTTNDRVLPFDRLLVGRADIKIITREQADRIIKRSQTRRLAEVKRQEEEAIARAMATAGKAAGAELLVGGFPQAAVPYEHAVVPPLMPEEDPDQAKANVAQAEPDRDAQLVDAMQRLGLAREA